MFQRFMVIPMCVAQVLERRILNRLRRWTRLRGRFERAALVGVEGPDTRYVFHVENLAQEKSACKCSALKKLIEFSNRFQASDKRVFLDRRHVAPQFLQSILL
jgi:hypothetical protein